MPALPPYILYLLATVLSFVISVYSVRKLIFITRKRKIYDIPDDIRKIHGAEIPTLGGTGIFVGYVIVAALCWPKYYQYMPYLLASSALLFFTGVYDDIMNMRPSKKLIVQLLASFITIYFADIRLEALYGFMGIEDIGYWPSIILSTLSCTFFINVFNFIDGIDGLACVLSILYTGTLGILFAAMGHPETACIAFALAGATGGLLVFNLAPAKIYMGDTGSMFLGFSIFIFSLLFIRWSVEIFVANDVAGFHKFKAEWYVHGPQQAMLLVLALLFLPIFDALRVFVLRASRRVSPLKADRTHLHYYLLDAGCNHTQAVTVILCVNILTLMMTYTMQDMPPLAVIGVMTAISLITLLVVIQLKKSRTRQA